MAVIKENKWKRRDKKRHDRRYKMRHPNRSVFVMQEAQRKRDKKVIQARTTS